jgi:regulator of protease activity HflC (stomatin/prohibitin superfamily)
MSAKRKQTKVNGFWGMFIIIVVLPVLLVNIWAGWKIIKIAKFLEVPLLGSVHQGPAQLAGLLLINCIVIVLLTAAREK